MRVGSCCVYCVYGRFRCRYLINRLLLIYRLRNVIELARKIAGPIQCSVGHRTTKITLDIRQVWGGTNVSLVLGFVVCVSDMDISMRMKRQRRPCRFDDDDVPCPCVGVWDGLFECCQAKHLDATIKQLRRIWEIDVAAMNLNEVQIEQPSRSIVMLGRKWKERSLIQDWFIQ